MKKFTSWVTMTVMLVLIAGAMTGPVTMVSAASGNSFSVDSVTACRDTTTVIVSGSSEFATNRISASVSYLDDDGDYVLLQATTTENFGSGSFTIPVVVDYSHQVVDADTSLQIIVQLQTMSGNGFVNLGDAVTVYANAADKFCQGKCSVSLTTADRAPTNGVITLRSHFGSWFRPEGWLGGAISVNAGHTVQMSFDDMPCDAQMRAWFYPATGADRTPRMLPSQYWPDEAGTGDAGSLSFYVASFARGMPATKPLESDDPYAPK